MRERSKVPLPEVPNYTDNVEFGELGLPLGFDDEQLLINLNAIDRVRKASGLGQVHISRVAGQQDPWTFSISGLDEGGLATGAATKVAVKRKFYETKVEYPSGSRIIGPGDTTIKLNGKAVDEEIEKSDIPRKHFDPHNIGKAINKGLKAGLNTANKEANLSKELLYASVLVYGGSSAFEQLLFIPITLSTPPAEVAEIVGIIEANVIVTLPVIVYASSAILAIGEELINIYMRKHGGEIDPKDEHPLQDFAATRKSLFVGASPDRYLAAAGIIKMSRLIHARS